MLMKSLVTFACGRDPAVAGAVASGAAARAGGQDRPRPSAPALDRRVLQPQVCGRALRRRCRRFGAGGAAAARRLAERGLDVIVVEQGGYHDASSYSEGSARGAFDPLPRGGLTVCEGRPAIPLPLGRCVGGTTVINSGSCASDPRRRARRMARPIRRSIGHRISSASSSRSSVIWSSSRWIRLRPGVTRSCAAREPRRSEPRTARIARNAGDVLLRNLPDRLQARRKAGGSRLGAAAGRRRGLRNPAGGSGRARDRGTREGDRRARAGSVTAATR